MRKLSQRSINLLMVIITLILFLWGGSIAFRDIAKSNKPDQDGWILDSNITDELTVKEPEISEKILVEFLSVNYLEDKEYLMRVEVGGEQVGIIYFDENGEIRFDGDKEKFEEAIFKAFDARRVK